MSKDLIGIVFSESLVSFVNRPTSLLFEASLGTMSVFDGNGHPTRYPILVKAKDPNDKHSVLSPVKSSLSSLPTPLIHQSIEKSNLSATSISGSITESITESLSMIPFFQMTYEQNPLKGHADHAVSIKMLPLQVVYNHSTVTSVIDFFSPQRSQGSRLNGQMSGIDALTALAEDTFEGLKAQTRANLEYAIQGHKTMDLKCEVEAPIFIFPER